MKTSYQVLLLLSLLSLTFITPVYTVCTDTNCLTCEDPAICTVCKDSFFVKTNACSGCGANCKTCTDETICGTCSDGFFLKDDKSCGSCFAGCKACADDLTCTTCSDGFLLSSDKKTCQACNTVCATCTGTVDVCATCKINFFLETSTCIQCGATGTNCKDCSATAGICKTCKDGYIVNTSTNVCSKCSANCAICTATDSCTSCLDGYYSDVKVCTKCPDGCATCSDSKICTACNSFYNLDANTKLCVKPDCSKDTKGPYVLINDLTCTDCKAAGYTVYNATYCQNMPVPTVKAEVADGKVKATINCAIGKNLYWAYGLAGSASLSLSEVQSLIKTPVVDLITFLQVGTQAITNNANDIVFAVLPKIKNTADLYTLNVFCEYLGANSTANTTFTSPNNTKLQTLTIGLTTTATLTSAQKFTVAGAIASVLGTTKLVWTDDEKAAPALSNKRILETAATVNFFILPDFTIAAAEDADITALKGKLTAAADLTKFATDVGTKAAEASVSVTFTAATATVAASFVAAPSLSSNYPNITVTDTTLAITLKQSGALGTLYWGYAQVDYNPNVTRTTIGDAAFAALTFKNSTAAALDTDVPISISGLTANKTYSFYYYGENNGHPRVKTTIFGQIITTTTTAPAPTGVEMLRYGFFVLLAMIMVILV